MDGPWRVRLSILLPHFCDKLRQPEIQFLSVGSSRRFSGHCCTLLEMSPFLCTLHSEKTRIAQALFFWVFAGTKPFDNSSSLVGHLNQATGSRVVFTFYLGGWKSLKSGSTFSFPAILETSKTTGSCYHWLQQIRHSVAWRRLTTLWRHDTSQLDHAYWQALSWIHSAIFNNPSDYTLGIIEYCFVYSQ